MHDSGALPDVFRLAHLSDPHLTSPVFESRRDLFNKRLLGYGSWRHRRRHEHRPEVLSALLHDLRNAGPDHTVITGDLTHLGLSDEFQQVAEWLPGVAPPNDVTVVPGNHDTYVSHEWERGLALWHDYMASDNSTACQQDPETFFPSLRIRGSLALIGLSSARPSAPLLAIGSLGQRQLEALSTILAKTAELDLCRVLLIHHPPKPQAVVWRKRLTDADALSRLIAERGAELILHGHSHRARLDWLATPAGAAPAIGVRSASAIGLHPGRRAQYHLYRITTATGRRSLEVEVREYAADRSEFAAVDTWSVDLPTPLTA